MMRWYKMQVGIVDDPKVRSLTDPEFRVWVNCLAVYRRDGTIDPRRLAIQIGILDANSLLESLIAKGMLDRTDGVIAPHDWLDWQGWRNGGELPEEGAPASKGAVRTRRWRERQERNGASHTVTRDAQPSQRHRDVTGDARDQDLDSDLDREKEENHRSIESSPVRAREADGSIDRQEASKGSRFEELETKLLALVPSDAQGWKLYTGRWVGAALVPAPLAPIAELLNSGFDFDRHIAPSIQRQIQAKLDLGETVDTWNYFVKGIIADRERTPEPAAPPAPAERKRLTTEELCRLYEAVRLYSVGTQWNNLMSFTTGFGEIPPGKKGSSVGPLFCAMFGYWHEKCQTDEERKQMLLEFYGGKRMEGWRRGKFWQKWWGPEPGHVLCHVPAELLTGDGNPVVDVEGSTQPVMRPPRLDSGRGIAPDGVGAPKV